MSSNREFVHEERIIKQIAFLEEAIKRLNYQEDITLKIADSIPRRLIPNMNKLVIKTTANREENKKLVLSLKKLLLEMNDPVKPYPKLVSLYLTGLQINQIDALAGHFGRWEDIIINNLMNTLESGAKLKSNFFKKIKNGFSKNSMEID